MKIKNNIILVFCVLGFLLGILDGFLAYDEEIQTVLEYTTDYTNFETFWSLFLHLFYRYFKYILIIYLFSVGYLKRIIAVIVPTIKSYFYSFTLILLVMSFDGFSLFRRFLMVFTQMTLSFIVTVIFAQITMNCIDNKYVENKNVVVNFFAFVFSTVCCIIIALIDLLMIKLVF